MELALCLKQTFGWTRTCGYRQAPPGNIQVGDVVVYHQTSCDDWTAHAVIVTSVTDGVKISCHSSMKHNAAYSYIFDSKPYAEWFHKN